MEEVLGHRYCDIPKLSARDRRAGRETDDEEVEYLVRGQFGEDEHDTFMPDTRWVALTELVAYIEEGKLAALDMYAKELYKTMSTVRKRVRRQA